MLDPASQRVGAEWIGKARAFRTEVRAVDTEMDRALDVVTAPLRARLKQKPKLRAAMVPDSARQYLSLTPSRFRIGKIDGAVDRTEFAIRETRLCVSWLTDDRWDEPEKEQGITICTFILSVHKGQLARRCLPLVAVSLHALARRVERHHDRSHEALWRDLAVLAAADEDGERVDTPPHGFWLGGVINAKGDDGRRLRIRSVRTWIDSDGNHA